MRNRLLYAAILLLAAAPLQAQMDAPRIGCFVDAAQRLRTVYGVAGSFVIGEPEGRGVLSALCTSRLTIVKTEAALEVNGTAYAAPEGPALIRRDGRVQYLSTGEWVRVTARSLESCANPGPLRSEAILDGDAVIVSGKRLELPSRGTSIHELGPGWYRVVLEDGSHAAVSAARAAVYRLPEIQQ